MSTVAPAQVMVIPFAMELTQGNLKAFPPLST